MPIWKDIIGTSLSFFRVGLTGPRLANVSGSLVVRNPAGTADGPITVSTVAISGDGLTINSDAANTGADRSITLLRPVTGMTASYSLTWPVDDGNPNQALFTDGNGVLSWITPTSMSDRPVTDRTDLVFGSPASFPLFALPDQAVWILTKIVIDTPFNGTPTLSLGISGQTAKYLALGAVDLTAAATTIFESDPGLPAAAGVENLIGTYAPGGATAGAARIFVTYVIPS